MKRQYIQPSVKAIRVVNAEMIATSGLYSTSKSADDSAILSNGRREWSNGWDED